MKVVVDLQDRRPIWAMPPWVESRLEKALPPGGELVGVEAASDGSGDGAARVDPRVLAAVEDADVYLGYGIHPDVLRRGARLRWVHSGAAGVGTSLTPEMLARDVLFTNSAGVHAHPIAETVLGMILYFARGFDLAAEAQRRGRWGSDAFFAEAAPITELGRSTVGVVGFGGIGREVARRAAGLGARVLALRRQEMGAGEEGHATVLHGPAGLARLLEESDYLVLAAPGTPETRGMIDRDALARMKPGAVLVNVSRGTLVDEDALVEALSGGGLRGAALDVFQSEPLREGHPLWSLPNALLTPHVSAVTRAFWERETELIVENLRRFSAGEPLLNVVDKRAGY